MRTLTLAACLAAAVLTTGPALAETLTYEDFLGQLTDMDRLMHLQDGVTAHQASSYHRGEATEWAFNADAGNFIRLEENGEGVMMEADGPGCIFRIWSANPDGTLRIYLDGAEEPTFEWGFRELFLGEIAPFVKPLIYKRDGGVMSASDCYAPIPYSKSIKVTCDPPAARFYIVNYLTYPEDWEVESFHLPLSDAEQAAMSEAADAWASPGADPNPELPGQQTHVLTHTIQPGETYTLTDFGGPGVIRGIRASVQCEQRHFWRKLILTGRWDEAPTPQVVAPLGAFFGFDWETPEYGSLVAGCKSGECYFYYPMPHRESAVLELKSLLAVPATVRVEIDHAPLEEFTDDQLYFHARWRHEPDSKSLDYPFVETSGSGHLVGVTLQIDHPIDGWWGEGDEKVWIDDERFPGWIGTGSEDYFGDAWGIRYLPGPTWGCSADPDTLKGLRTCPYRWHFTDLIPFTERIRMTIENYGSWGVLDADEFEYNSVAYWYQKELVPPFEDLAGHTYIGGTEYLQTPSEYEYRTDLFLPELTLADVRTSGLSIPYTIEAESVLANTVEAGDASLIDDALLPHQLNGELAVDFGEATAGEALSEFEVTLPTTGVYYVTLYTTPETNAAELTLTWNGEPLAVIGKPAPNQLELEGIYAEAGIQRMGLATATAGRAVLDCLQLLPARSVTDVFEAEWTDVVSSTSDEPPAPSVPRRGLSAGRTLVWVGAEGAEMTLVAPPSKPNVTYVLGARVVYGPDAGVIQAYVDGKPVGAALDLYAPTEELRPTILPLGPLPLGETEVTIRSVGKNPASTGHRVEFDYFRWEPLILHPDSAEGVWASVSGFQGCGYSTQDLGDRFVGGHHLWVQPSGDGAYVDIELRIPEDGDYRLTARLTTSWDYAIATASLDGQVVGEPADLYSKEVQQTEALDYGAHALTAGTHVFRLQATGRNPESAGHLMGMDYLLVEKID